MATASGTDHKDAVTVVGLPFSTFTRTITMGLTIKGIPFKQIAEKPHSEAAKQHHPYGRIPAVGFRHVAPASAIGTSDDGLFWLFESLAVARYIDSTAPAGSTVLCGSSAGERAVIDQWCSAAADYLFSSIEHGVIKPRMAMAEQQLNEQKISAALAPAIEKAKQFLVPFEKLAADSAAGKKGPFLVNGELSWVDLFVAPILADLAATADADRLISKTVNPHLFAWLTGAMTALPAFQSTYTGTLAAANASATVKPKGA